MSASDHIEVVCASSEFVALCQSQIALLTKGLGASWSAVYLSEKLADSVGPKLVPVVVYPETDTFWPENLGMPALPEVWNQTELKPKLLSAQLSEQVKKSLERKNKSLRRRGQIVLPLIYEDMVMGLLMTRREDREWSQTEYNQIQKIATTIAIACLLDRRQSWYQQQLTQQQNIRKIERQRLDDFLHQLRNPLTALRTFSKLLLKRFLSDDGEDSLRDRNRSVVQSMLQESDRLGDLVKQFEGELETDPLDLTLNTATDGIKELANYLPPSKELKLEPVALKEVLEALLPSAEAIAFERGIELNADIPSSLLPVTANASALREVLSNIIDNALKYTPTGGKVQIKAGLEKALQEGNWRGIAISDTGCGIPDQDRSRIFQRHYRGVQANGNVSGSGLGLAIALELTEQMHGQIELISFERSLRENSPGTTFIVWLPAKT
jgi:signal transduction histidine kinase